MLSIFCNAKLFFLLLPIILITQTKISLAESSKQTITEIFIKGSSWDLPLKEVAASASILSPSSKEISHLTNFQDLSTTVPNLTWAGGTARPRFFQIRGIGEFEQYSGAPNPSVATVIDGVDLSGLGISSSMFDTKQVEVLRGPQATRYGASALAGLINVISQAPTPYISGFSQLSIASDELNDFGFAVGGPFTILSTTPNSDDWQFRFSFNNHSSNGFRNNQFLKQDETNQRQELTSRIKLRYQPSVNFNADLTTFQVDNDNGYDVFAIDNSFNTQSDRPGTDQINLNAGSLKLEYQFGQAWKIISTTSRYQSSQDYAFDGDWGNNIFWGANAPYDYYEENQRSRKFFSQEIRASSNKLDSVHGQDWQWLWGVYGQSLTELSNIQQQFAGLSYNSLDSRYRANTLSTFGELEAPLTKGNSLRIGARLEQRKANYFDSNDSDLSPTDKMWGTNISYNHDLNAKTRVYTLISRGFKGGGVNSGARVADQDRTYGPEFQWNLEAGLKGIWLTNKLTTNLAIFHALRRASQLKLALQDDPNDPLAFTYITQNQGRGKSAGLEVEATLNARDWLNFSLSGSLLETKFTSVPEPVANISGRDFSYAPKWNFNLSSKVNFTTHTFLKLDLHTKDAFYFDDSHNQKSSAYSIINLSLGLDLNQWSFSFWGKNIFDNNFATRGFFFGNEPPDFPSKLYKQLGDPRQVGVSVAYRF